MSDYDLPDLPSDKDLGITEEDLRSLEETGEAPRDGGSRESPADGGAGGSPPTRSHADEHEPRRWRGPLTLALLLALSWTASIRSGLPEPVPADAPDTAFSAARAMAVVSDIARAPRPPGSPEHARVRENLVSRLTALGLEPSVQTTTAALEGDGFARTATVRNVVARVPGTDPTGALLLTAHYDGTELSPAAADNASGVATVLEAVRAIQAGDPLRNDVIVLFTDAEEVGLLGAEAFVRDHPWLEDVEVVVSFEMRGSAGPSILFETGSENGTVVRALRDATPDAFGTSLGEAFYPYMPNATDFTVFERAGKQGLNFAAVDNASVYHTPRDLPSELSNRTLQHHGLHAMAALRGLGNDDLSDVRGPDAVYFSVPGIGLVTYGSRWVIPLSGLLVLGALGAFVLALRRGARTTAVLAGFGLSIVALSLGYGAGLVLVDWARGAHAEAGRLPAALFYGEGWYVLAIAAAALVVVSTLLSVVRSRMSLPELTLGVVILPLAAAIGLSIVFPEAAAPLQWATLSTLLSAALLVLLGSRGSSHTGWLAALLLAVPAFVFLVPAAELLWLAGTLRLAGALGAFIVLSLLLALPAIDHLREPNGWWVPALALLAAVGAVGMARLGSDVSPLTPVPSTLVYQYEHGSENGFWITDSATVEAGGPTSQASEWLAARAGTGFTQRMDFTEVGYRPGRAPVAEAPAASVLEPVLTIRNDTTEGIVRRVTLDIRSRIGAERLYFARSVGAESTRITSVNGRALANPYDLTWVDHWGVPDSVVVLGLEMPAGSEIDLVVSEHHLRPAEILGPGTFQRPPGLEANVLRMSDRAILTTRLQPETVPSEAPPPADTLPSLDTLPALDTLPTLDPLPGDTATTGASPAAETRTRDGGA
ncbi:MAG: M28 family peptidase [Gemmatimonadota bacterium]|nr:M28 family peptidase [Gemmatimonadota bacterium]